MYIKNGMYERHKHKICSLYASRMRALKESAERYNEAGLIEVPGGSMGIYAQLKLQPTVNMERLIKRLAERHISVVSGKGFYLSDYLEREKFVRISISQTKPEQIDEGVKAIIEEVRKAGHW